MFRPNFYVEHIKWATNHYQPHYCERTSGQLFLFGETEDAKESHGRLWKTFSSRKYNSYNWYCELIFLVKLALQIYVFFYHISSSHNANTHIRAVFQRAATIAKSWYWSWSVGKPCQISNQHHCYHHHRPCQPTLSSPKSFHYKTFITHLLCKYSDSWLYLQRVTDDCQTRAGRSVWFPSP